MVDQTTQFSGSVQEAEETPGSPYVFDVENPELQVVSAKEMHAYPGIELHRTMAMVVFPGVENEVIIDLYRIENDTAASYELPFYHGGHLMNTSFEYFINKNLEVMGEKYGYQHLWKEAEGNLDAGGFQVTWFNGKHFYSMTSASKDGDKAEFGRIGANDPNFNLRRDPVLIHKRGNTRNTLFANVFEIHGAYNPSDEIPVNSFSSVKKTSVILDSEEYSVVEVELINDQKYYLSISNKDASIVRKHEVETINGILSWTGPFQLTSN